MIHLSLNELKLIAQYRNRSDYENKSKVDLIKALGELKTKIRINYQKLEEIRKDFYDLGHKFSKKEIGRYRKSFYVIKNRRHHSTSEIKETEKNLTELKESLRFKKFHRNIDSVDYDDLGNYDYNYDFADDDEYRKIGSIRTLFKEFDRDYYKPLRTDGGFGGRNNNYIEYTSKGDRYENVSPKEYLNMIRPYLRNLINEDKLIDDDDDDDDTDSAEWKIQLTMQNSYISTKSFEETRNIYTKSEPLEIFIDSDTENVTDQLFNTLLQRFQREQKTLNERGSEFISDNVELLYYHFRRIDSRRDESYIISPDWIASKKATINPKNEKDNKCFQWSIIAGLNYNKIKEKELKKLLKFRRVDTDFSSYQRDWEEFEQNNASIALNILFVS